MTGRAWDAEAYDRVARPMAAMAADVLDRLPLAGTETVLDAGCGTGQVTEWLLGRLPRGRVVAVDADPAMVAAARRRLGGRARVLHQDLLDLELDEPVDAVLSTATFHWVPDNPRLFERLHAALGPGGRLVAQCGGGDNLAVLRAVADEVAAEAPFAAALAGFRPPWYYPGPEETADRLATAGFVEVRIWLEPRPVVIREPLEYLATVPLGAQVQQLPEELRRPYAAAVAERLGDPVTADYVRLNIDARRAG